MSVDFGLLAKLIVDSFTAKKDKESFQSGLTDYISPKITAAQVISVILSILLGLLAFYLSWTCNTALGYHIVIRTFFGVFAFLFGLTYILLYILMRWDTCAKITKRF